MGHNYKIKQKDSNIKDFRFVIVVYGDDYIGFLLANIYSITKSNPGVKITVIWKDICRDRIILLKKAFPSINFVKSDIDIQGDIIKRISSKTKLWEMAVEKYSGDNLCLLDSDTLVLKDIAKFFEKDFDVLFTEKHKEIIPLNTGVMLIKNSEKVLLFFRFWRQKTSDILEDKDEREKANNTKDYPYGGADQMSLYQILEYKRNINRYIKSIQNEKLTFQAMPCYILNETRSCPITKDTHIIHYKAGWRPILARGSNFTENRTKEESFAMYILFLKIYKEAIELLKKRDSKVTYKDFNIKIPFYINKATMEENKIKYCIFFILNKLFFDNYYQLKDKLNSQ